MVTWTNTPFSLYSFQQLDQNNEPKFCQVFLAVTSEQKINKGSLGYIQISHIRILNNQSNDLIFS